MRGHQWLIDCSDCLCDAALLSFSTDLESACVALCRAADLQVVGRTFHQFDPAGVTGVVLLAESHLSVHTWPVERFAAVDIYVCNHEQDNRAKGDRLARDIASLFRSSRSSVRELVRESVGA